MHRVIKFSQKAWLKQFNDMNTEKREIAKTDFEKHFFKVMNNAVFGKNYGKGKKIIKLDELRGIKLLTFEARRNYLV